MNYKKSIDIFVCKIKDSDLIFEKRDLSEQTENLEDRLDKKFPKSFCYLISNYAFAPFEIEPIYFYANHREGFLSEDEKPFFYDEFDLSKNNLSNAIFQDKIICKLLSANGFIRFARPFDGSYDPICFDAGKKKAASEFPIVRLDHEEILCNEMIKINQHISDSFLAFV